MQSAFASIASAATHVFVSGVAGKNVYVVGFLAADTAAGTPEGFQFQDTAGTPNMLTATINPGASNTIGAYVMASGSVDWLVNSGQIGGTGLGIAVENTGANNLNLTIYYYQF